MYIHSMYAARCFNDVSIAASNDGGIFFFFRLSTFLPFCKIHLCTFFFHFSNGGDFFPSSFSSSSFSISVYLYDINMYWVDFGVQNLLWECVCDCVCARVDYVDSNREYELDRKKSIFFLLFLHIFLLTYTYTNWVHFCLGERQTNECTVYGVYRSALRGIDARIVCGLAWTLFGMR